MEQETYKKRCILLIPLQVVVLAILFSIDVIIGFIITLAAFIADITNKAIEKVINTM
jgi:hypothetical protein